MTPLTARPQSRKLLDEAQIRATFATLVEPGQITEVRVLSGITSSDRYPGTYSGYFDNTADLIQHLRMLRGWDAVYLTLQSCDPDLFARAANRLKKMRERDPTTSDNNIVRYRWLFIDCDPKRVAKISSTDQEHEQVLLYSRQIRETLAALGWPQPILADSGNGAHLLYRIDLDVSAARLVERTLKGIAERFNTETIDIDQKVFNPARIDKLYGTLVCKGDDVPNRPHRMCHFLEVPEQLVCVDRALLEAIAAPEVVQQTTPQPQANALRKVQKGKKEALTSPEDFLRRHQIRYEGPIQKEGKTRYVLSDGCVFDPSHCGRDAAIIVQKGGKWGYNCFHNSCAEKQWADFRKHFEPDYVPQGEREIGENEPSTATKLLWIAEQARLIVTPAGDLFARVPVTRGGHVHHHEVVSINERGSGFRRWLVYMYSEEYGSAPNSDALTQVMSLIQAHATYRGERASVHTRIAVKDGCVYLDLANETWECVEIRPDGWSVITCPPVYFRRPNGMLPLPRPEPSGNLHDLRQLINVKSEKDYVLVVGWLVGTLHPYGPYAALNLNGERGSGKSKTEAILRNLIDPNSAPTRNAPRDEREAAISAQNNMIVALDNLSSMPLWLSDVLCRISTGSGFATRELYENDVEKIFNSKRPIILNGIEDTLISQGDLLSRTMLVTLSPPERYIPEEELDERFQELHPGILGALLSVASVALRDRRKVRLEHVPRMADFAAWVTAAEPALGWEPGTFMDVYTENQDNASSIVMESSPVAKALVQLMQNQPDGWFGLISELHEELKKYEVYKDAKRAPKDATRLSGQLKRIAASLRTQGIDIQQAGRQKRGSFVAIRCEQPTSTSHAASDPVEAVQTADALPVLTSEKALDEAEKSQTDEVSLNEERREPEQAENAGTCVSPEPAAPPREVHDDTIEALLDVLPQVRTKLPPNGQAYWHLRGSGFERNDHVDHEVYLERLRICLLSGDQQRIRLAQAEIQRRLTG